MAMKLTVAKVLIPAIVILAIWQVSVSSDSSTKPTAADKQSARDSFLMVKGQESVLSKLKDPKSADFRAVYLLRSGDDRAAICGEVNSKNAFGGYVGFQRFVSSGAPEATFLENEPHVSGSFQELWNRVCVK